MCSNCTHCGDVAQVSVKLLQWVLCICEWIFDLRSSASTSVFRVVPFSGCGLGSSPVPRWWEPPPAPTRVLLGPVSSHHPCAMELEQVLGIRGQLCVPLGVHAVASSLSLCVGKSKIACVAF